MRERLRHKASRILDNADALVAEGRQAIPEVVDPLVELIEQLRTDGIVLSIVREGGKLKLKIEPSEPKENVT